MHPIEFKASLFRNTEGSGDRMYQINFQVLDQSEEDRIKRGDVPLVLYRSEVTNWSIESDAFPSIEENDRTIWVRGRYKPYDGKISSMFVESYLEGQSIYMDIKKTIQEYNGWCRKNIQQETKKRSRFETLEIL